MKTKYSKIIFFFFILIFISCKKETFNIPTEYACLGYKESDSIIEKYSLQKIKKDKDFKTMLGFELYKPNEENSKRLEDRINFDNNRIKISEKTIPFNVYFNQFNDTTFQIQIEAENTQKQLFKTINIKQSIYQEKLNLENHINDKYESIQTTFENILENLKTKYGSFNFYENNSMTKNVFDRYDSENDYQYTRYFWIKNDVLITLKHEIFYKDDFENGDKDLRVKIKKEFLVLLYESISTSKMLKEKANEEWKENMKREIEKNEKIEQKKDSLNQIEKDKLLNEL